MIPRLPRSLAAVLLAFAVAMPATADTDIQTLFRELQPQLAALRDDPFDPGLLQRQKQALFARYAGIEVRIPAPPAGMARSGNRQKLWPLEFRDGRLQLEFFVNRSLGFAGELLDSPLNYWSSDRTQAAEGRRDSDGRPCTELHERSGYGLLPAAPTGIQTYVDDPYRLPGRAPQEHLDEGLYHLDLAIDVARARALSGQLLTYVQLAELHDSPEIDPVRASATVRVGGRCHAGQRQLLAARISHLRIHNRASGEDLLRLRFEYPAVRP